MVLQFTTKNILQNLLNFNPILIVNSAGESIWIVNIIHLLNLDKQ